MSIINIKASEQMWRYCLSFLICCAFFQGCQNGAVDPSEYISAVKNPAYGLKTEKAFEELTYQLQYLPAPYRALQSLDTLYPDKETFEQQLTGKSGEHHFLLTIRPNTNQSLLKMGNPSRKTYKKRVQYYAFKMKQDIQLIEGNDTLRCSNYHFERTYNAQPGKRFLLGFPKNSSNKGEDKLLAVTNRYGKTGKVYLRIEGSSIQGFPKLKITNNEPYQASY